MKNVEPFLSQFRNCDKRVYGICPGVDEARQTAATQAVLDARARGSSRDTTQWKWHGWMCWTRGRAAPNPDQDNRLTS